MVMLSWDKLLELHKNPPNIRIMRNDNIQLEYDKFIKYIKDNNININDYIYRKFLNDKKVNFTPNTFPYDIDHNCNHYIIWFDTIYFEELLKKNAQDEIINYIVRTKFINNNYIYFENLNHNKSVLNVKHFHIFIKN